MKLFSSSQNGAFLLTICLFVGLPWRGAAQTTPRPSGPYFVEALDVSVEKGTRQLSSPFAGGLAAPQFAQADLNKDGLLDLVVYEAGYTNADVRTFINEGSAGTPKYVYTPRFARHFLNVVNAPRYPTTVSDVSNFIRLLDYNCDGIPDLFTGGYPGVHVSKGAYNSQNELYFTYYKPLYYPSSNGPINVFVSGSDLPGIADVDGDGDLDVVTYAAAGSKMEWYRNYRVERRLPCDSVQLELETSCWGRVRQGINRTLFTRMNGTCTVQNPPFWDPNTPSGPDYVPAPAEASKTAAHGSNTICLLDIDGDGDMDILNSSESFDDMQLQLNGRKDVPNRITDSIVAQDTLWQTDGTMAAMRTFPAAFYTDYDADGKNDILVAPHFTPPSSRDKNQVFYYRNTGTATAPVFVYQKDSLLCEDMIDEGSNSHPLFYDFNRDGRKDILLGSTVTDAGGTRHNQLAYYQNITTSAGTPKYKFVTSVLAHVDTLQLLGCAPAVGDLDGDGKDDLLIGLENGSFAFYKNGAPSNAVPPQWSLEQVPFKNANGGSVMQVPGYAAPFIYDVNGDGRPDILSGSSTGRLAAFLNATPVAGVPVFGAKIDSLGKALIDSTYGTRLSTPYIGVADSTGETYLIMGSNTGVLQAWKFPDSTALTATYVRADGGLSFVKSAGRSAPAVGDMDGDGRLELLVGGKWGGLNLYRNGFPPIPPAGVKDIAAQTEAPVGVFPNPATTGLTVRRQGSNTTDIRLVLRNLLGQAVQSATLPAGVGEAYIDVAPLPAGLYLLSVQGEGIQWNSKVQILR